MFRNKLLILQEHEWMKYGEKHMYFNMTQWANYKGNGKVVRNNLDFFHEKNSKGFDLYIINSTQIAFNQCGRFNSNILVKSFQILYWKCPCMWTRFWFYEKKCSKDNKHWINMLILNLFSNLWDQQAWPHKQWQHFKKRNNYTCDSHYIYLVY